MTSFALLFTMASIGISETVYLIRKRVAAEKPMACHSCLVFLVPDVCIYNLVDGNYNTGE